jgi:hypothetical protein
MTAKETCKWMKDKGYLGKWILPEGGLNQDKSKEVKRYYKDKPPGDRPELMKWDNRLNKTLHECVTQHITATSHMNEDDPRKFLLATPKQGTSAYLRCLTVSPPSKRVIKDWQGIIDLMWRIRTYSGIVVPDSKVQQVDRVGHHAAAARIGGEPSKRGGNRPRKQAEDDFGKNYVYHPDAQSALIVKLEALPEKFAEA